MRNCGLLLIEADQILGRLSGLSLHDSQNLGAPTNSSVYIERLRVPPLTSSLLQVGTGPSFGKA